MRAAALGLALGGAGVGALLFGLRWLHPARAQSTAAIPALESPYRTEEDWLLTTVAADLTGMAALAANPRSGRPVAKVTVGRDQAGAAFVEVLATPGATFHEPLRIAHSIWSPEDYEPLARRLMDGLLVSATPSPPAPEDERLLRRLLERRADVIEAENESTSGALREHPSDPTLHEDAALLLGAFAMREAAGSSTDIRHALCRMTAHLAFARALRGSGRLGVSGRYAQVTLSALSQRGAEAEAELEELRASLRGNDVQEAWRRILLMRISEDWRTVGDLAKASLAERLEWLRAADRTLGSARALVLLQRAGAGPGPEADWTWILTRDPSVEIANAVLDYGLDATLSENDRVWSLAHGGPLAPGRRIEALNEPAPAFVTAEGPRVIAWGTWASMYQRQVLHLLERSQYHYRHKLALAEGAGAVAAEKTAEYSGLALFPVLAACWEAEKKTPVPAPLLAAIAFVGRHPELVNADYWGGLQVKAGRQGLSGRLPSAAAWFATGCVRGTTFEVGVRRQFLPVVSRADSVKALVATSPRSYEVALARLSSPEASFADAEAAFGDRAQYDPRAMRRLSDRAYVENPEASLGLTRRMCELDPGWCGRLGGDCVNLGDEAGAVVAYERMIEEAADRVMVSNNCAWLVKHYLRDGRRARAKEIAEMAAEVGSAEGLLTMAGFLEETGRYEEAEGLIRRVRERYPEDGPDFVLFGFHHRMVHVRRLPSYERSLAQETRDLFPRGLEKVTLASLTGPPIDGATFTEETPSLRRNGMQKGDVVVALDGWRVRTLQQYYAIRSFDDDPDLRLIIWRDGKYAEVAARRMYRSFGAEMSDYPPRHERSPGSAPAAAK